MIADVLAYNKRAGHVSRDFLRSEKHTILAESERSKQWSLEAEIAQLGTRACPGNCDRSRMTAVE